jgi:hypothetical protein
MNSMRQGVGWGFGNSVSEFAFLDLKKRETIVAGRCNNV